MHSLSMVSGVRWQAVPQTSRDEPNCLYAPQYQLSAFSDLIDVDDLIPKQNGEFVGIRSPFRGGLASELP